MIYTSEFCSHAWKSSTADLDEEQRLQLNLKWLDYWNHLARNLHKKTESSDDFSKSVIAYLKQEGVLKKSASILDIGAGDGKYTQAFAKECSAVTALDMSSEMLQVLKNRSAHQQQKNIKTVCATWDRFHSSETYDVVFSSLCPAICDEKSLAKMESYSRDYCVLLAVARNSHSEIRQNLHRILTDQPLVGLSPDVIYILNLLYANEKYPNVKFYKIRTEPEMTIAEAFETYSIYYGIWGFNDADSRNKIYHYLRKSSQHDICRDHVEMNLALVYWQK